MSQEQVVVYVAGSCGPCSSVKKLIKKGKVNVPVKMVDVEQKENFHLVEELGLSKVPTAMSGGHECKMSFSEDGNSLVIECPEAVA